MFIAVDYKDGKFGVLDTDDGVTEYVTPEVAIKYLTSGYRIRGMRYSPQVNPMYTVKGIEVNLAYQRNAKVGKWIGVLLRSGDRFGMALSVPVNGDYVAFYDSSANFDPDMHPLGQYVTMYRWLDMCTHKGDLVLNGSVPGWTVRGSELRELLRKLSAYK